ncbi:recombinase family protein [Clostridium sp.]
MKKEFTTEDFKNIDFSRGVKVGYIRVSSYEQNPARQEVLMKELGVEKLFLDKLSGKDTKRPQLQAMLDYVREGDTVVIESLSRLGRSVKDLIEINEELTKKGVALESKKEKIETLTASGRLMFNVIASIAQFEREIMLERQREGIAIAKAAGKYKGRKEISKPENWDEVISKWKVREITATKAMEELGLKRTTFYKLLKESNCS